MPCHNCGNPKTIKAHLIPRVFCKQVQAGNSHAARVDRTGMFTVSQSGIWDGDILCSKCDNILGAHENYAHKVFSVIRNNGSDEPGKIKVVDGADCKTLLRFFCGILYKFSITKMVNGRISLNRYQDICRTVAFTNQPIPHEIDAFIFRLIRFSNDGGIFAYRAPILDRKLGVNVCRFMLGGMVVFVILDKRSIDSEAMMPILLKNAPSLVYVVAPAQSFEEFRLTAEIVSKQANLAEYLSKMDHMVEYNKGVSPVF